MEEEPDKMCPHNMNSYQVFTKVGRSNKTKKPLPLLFLENCPENQVINIVGQIHVALHDF